MFSLWKKNWKLFDFVNTYIFNIGSKMNITWFYKYIQITNQKLIWCLLCIGIIQIENI